MNITEAEWKIMKVVWENSPLSLKEIAMVLNKETDWTSTTIRTLIVRLMEKGLIEADKSTGNFKYYPIAKKEECQLEETKSFIQKVYDGSLGMLLTNFVKETKLTEKERAELMEIIKKVE